MLGKWIGRAAAALGVGPYYVWWGTVQEMLADLVKVDLTAKGILDLRLNKLDKTVIVGNWAEALKWAKAIASRLNRPVRVSHYSTAERKWKIHPDGRVEEIGPELEALLTGRDTPRLEDLLDDVVPKVYGGWSYVVYWGILPSTSEMDFDPAKSPVFDREEDAQAFAIRKAREAGRPVLMAKGVVPPRSADPLREGLFRKAWNVTPDGKMMTLSSGKP